MARCSLVTGGHAGATGPSETDRDRERLEEFATREVAGKTQTDRDQPRSASVPLNPKVEGSNPSRPMQIRANQADSAWLRGVIRARNAIRVTPCVPRCYLGIGLVRGGTGSIASAT